MSEFIGAGSVLPGITPASRRAPTALSKYCIEVGTDTWLIRSSGVSFPIKVQRCVTSCDADKTLCLLEFIHRNYFLSIFGGPNFGSVEGDRQRDIAAWRDLISDAGL